MSPGAREKILRGIGVSHGIAIGPAFLVQVDRPRVPQWRVKPEDIAAEQARFQQAVMTAQNELGELKEKSATLPDTAAEEVGLLLDAHLAMLSGSRLVRGVVKRIADEGINAEAAIEHVMQDLTDQFRALRDKYIAARIDDVEAVSNRLIRILMNLPYIALDSVPPGGIVLAKEISPADTALMDPQRFAGLATAHGGAAGHTAVMARSLGIPAVLGLDAGLLESGGHGGTAIVDGVAGVLILNPAPATLDEYRARQQALQNAREALGRKLAETSSQARLLAGLAGTFGLPRPPRRVEVYDNSHIMGTNAVGAMIVAGAEGFVKNQYRKFNIRSTDITPGDDFGMMREVMQRRFSRLIREHAAPQGEDLPDDLPDTGAPDDDDDDDAFPAWPDLILIDGGQGQMSSVRAILDELGIADKVAAIGVAKGVDRDAGRERFFVAGREPFMLPVRDPVLYFVQRLRDEAHRFAIGSHRTRRRKEMVRNPLDEIAGIGPTRKRALLHHFGTAKAVSRAAVEDLMQVEGVSERVARMIYDHFHEKG